jgi:DNA polymerase III subunit delta
MSAWPGMLGLMQSPTRFGAVLLITGPESLLASRAVSEFIAQASAERPDAAVNRLEAGDCDAGSLAEATGASLFASATITVINDVAELPAELGEQLLGLASDPGADLALAVVHGGGVKGKGLLDKLKKLRPEIVDCPSIKPWELGQFVVSETRHLGGKATAKAADALVRAVGTNTRALSGAVRQLLDDSDDHVLTVEAIQRYFAGRAEVTSFAVAEDALAGNAEGALGKLRWAMVTGVAPVLVTSALAANLRSLGKYLGGREARMRDAELARSIGVPPWKLKDLSRLSRDWKPAAVAKAIQAVAVADAQIKGAGSDPGFALEQLVLQVIAARRSPARRRATSR